MSNSTTVEKTSGVVNYRHRKSGVVYESLGVMLNAGTDTPVMAYKSLQGFMFVRDLKEFYERFIRVD